jgi:hypothetical protein
LLGLFLLLVFFVSSWNKLFCNSTLVKRTKIDKENRKIVGCSVVTLFFYLIRYEEWKTSFWLYLRFGCCGIDFNVYNFEFDERCWYWYLADYKYSWILFTADGVFIVLPSCDESSVSTQVLVQHTFSLKLNKIWLSLSLSL